MTGHPVYGWLHELRLHKYTPNLSHLEWKDLINLDDGELEKLGVSTQGARSKLIKASEILYQPKALMLTLYQAFEIEKSKLKR